MDVDGLLCKKRQKEEKEKKKKKILLYCSLKHDVS